MDKRIRKAVFVGSAALSGAFWFLFFDTWFKRRGCFNELGRCFDSETGVVYHEQSGAIWVSLAIVASGFALYQLWQINR